MFVFVYNGNNVGRKGCLAFLNLLNDISSIESTAKSNHTMKVLGLVEYGFREMSGHIDSTVAINRVEDNPARQKIIKFQLDSTRRQELCCLQGVTSPYSSIFSGIDPVVLPELLSLVGNGRYGGQSVLGYVISCERTGIFVS